MFKDRNGKIDSASGTLIEIGGRIFVATVAHARPRDNASILFIRKTKVIAPDGVQCVMSHVSSRNNEIDVAAFEIDPSTPNRLGAVPIGLDRIGDNTNGIFDMKAFVVGYPAEYSIANTPVAA